MLVHARKGRGTVQGLEEKRAKVPWVLEEVSLYVDAVRSLFWGQEFKGQIVPD